MTLRIFKTLNGSGIVPEPFFYHTTTTHHPQMPFVSDE